MLSTLVSLWLKVAALGLKIFPLYINISLGYIACKKLGIAREMVAPLIVYILAPIVVFGATLQVELSASVVLVPLTLFCIAAVICFGMFYVGKKIWTDRTKNLAAFSCGTGNTGYFGIPLAIILLNEHEANIYILALVISFLYEYTIGFYIISRGSYTFTQSMIKIVKLPVIYAAIAGFACNLMQVNFSGEFIEFLTQFRGAYAILGMMMIGMGLVGLKNVRVDKKFIAVTFFAKFIIWPAAALLVAFIDSNFIHAFDESAYRVMLVYAIVPMAANTVIMATLFNVRPQEASFAILLSTAVAFFTIPLMAALFL
ncbi:MAG: AEC family transporter [Campylobacteraceae bacterium]|jgi:predicted permease|nr:AEC family transporter [Campylobacteraceae bacterium]